MHSTPIGIKNNPAGIFFPYFNAIFFKGTSENRTKTETNTILILSKAILCTGGLEALRAQINAAQNQKCIGLKGLSLAVRWRRCSRQGRASSPTVGERALPASQQIGNLGTWEVSRCAL